MPTRLDEITGKILPILREAGVRRASLFGSYVRDEAGAESDIDILIDLPEGKSLFDLVDLKLKLEEALGRNVDVVEYDALKPRLKGNILAEQQPIL